MGFFSLQSGERVIWEAKPIPNWKWLLFVQTLFGWGIFSAIFLAWILVAALSAFRFAVVGGAVPAFGLFLIIFFFVLLFLVPYAVASLVYGKEHYWLTNQRIVRKSGFIGYKVNSVPLERVSDVVVSRSFVESIFGFASVHVQTLAGQVSYGRFGAGAAFKAVSNPEELQKLVFDSIRGNRKKQKLAI